MDLGVRIRTHWQCRNPLHDAARTALQPPSQVHAHMIRHATGYKLANAGRDTRSIQGYLGHKDIRHTVRYTEPTRFKNFWPD
jgi:site-specific recombinase XerD